METFQQSTAKVGETLLNAIFAHIPLFMMLVDAEGRIEKLSRSLRNFYGKTPEKGIMVRGGDIFRCIHHLDDPKGCGYGPFCRTCGIRRTVLDTLETGEPHYKVRAKLKSINDPKDTRHFLISTAPVYCREIKALVFVEDITDEINSRSALKEQKDFFHALLETISNPIFYKDARGRYTGCNKAFENFIGKSRSEIIGRTVFDMGPEEIARVYFEKDRELFDNPGQQHYEGRVKTSYGVTRDVIFDKATLHDADGNVNGLVGVISDITDRKYSEKIVRHLSQMLIQAQERERKMISCELHDSIAQNLSTLKLYCGRLNNGKRHSQDEMEVCISEMAALIDQTVSEVRNLAYDLSPPSLDQLGLVNAIGMFCEEFSEKYDIAVDFKADGIDESGMPAGVSINFYRLVHEGLGNVRKHSSATRAEVVLLQKDSRLFLRIEDNGRGFDVRQWERTIVKDRRLGLRSMKERVNLLGGYMVIRSVQGTGTCIEIELPLEGRTDEG